MGLRQVSTDHAQKGEESEGKEGVRGRQELCRGGRERIRDVSARQEGKGRRRNRKELLLQEKGQGIPLQVPLLRTVSLFPSPYSLEMAHRKNSSRESGVQTWRA